MKCAIVTNAPVSQSSETQTATRDSFPRKDYLMLAESLGAEIIAPEAKVQPGIGSYFKAFAGQAWQAFRRRNEYEIVLTMSEQVGLVLALLFKIFRCNKPHVMISHYMTPARKSMFVKLFGVDSNITRFVCYGSAQASYLQNELGIPSEKIELILHPADAEFWRPMPVPTERLIVSAGLLARDYATLIKAVEGLDVEIVIAANSPWMGGEKKHTRISVPDNVRFVKCTPTELRDLYARAMFVAVPLLPVNIQAGSLVIYESMAMGKAVITTNNGGNIDIVRDGETGLYVPPQDPDSLRNAIIRLLEDDEEAKRMGTRGREVVEQGLNLDTYSHNVAQIVHDVWERQQVRAGTYTMS